MYSIRLNKVINCKQFGTRSKHNGGHLGIDAPFSFYRIMTSNQGENFKQKIITSALVSKLSECAPI